MVKSELWIVNDLMAIQHWIRDNARGLIGYGIQGVVYTFGSFLSAFQSVLLSTGLPSLTNTQAFSVLLGFSVAGLLLIAWNDIDKANRRKLFGEPDWIKTGIRHYETRYALPRLDYAFGRARTRILILGRALAHIAVFDSQLVGDAVRDGKDVTLYFSRSRIRPC